MEIQFRRTAISCLRKVVHQTVTQEQTQEIRLPENLPDIGRVLGCWGQVIVRSKEWRGTGMTVSGGVMAWVLYAPEDGQEPGSVECWIPFQLKWDFPQTQRDGSILVWPQLKGIDARCISARKLMVRACVTAMGDAMEPMEQEIACADHVPEDIQLLKESYPVELPVEAGEKLFDMEESIPAPEQPKMGKLLHYCMEPGILEEKVMAGRLVLRGKCAIHMLYRAEDGSIHSWDTEVPFSQYTQLDRDYSAGAEADIRLLLTALEIEMGEGGNLQLRCGMAAQYVIYDRMLVETVSDAYSIGRTVEPELEELVMPIRLDVCHEDALLKGSMECQAQRILEVSRTGECPAVRAGGNSLEIGLNSQFQVLYFDENGALQCGTIRMDGSCAIPSDSSNRAEACTCYAAPQAYQTGAGIAIEQPCQVAVSVFSQQGLPMVTELKLGEEQKPDSNRPSLILRPMDDGRLWDIAKACHTTVDAIRNANKLTQEPEKGQMLLIPVP